MYTPRFVALLCLLACVGPALAQREFGFDNRKPSGQPYLSPAETVKRMKVADGFEVKLFAGEPQLVNPIAMTVDEKGRVWVVECFEYPSRTPPGKMPRDRVVILEDTDGDGTCDRRTVFAEGKDFPRRFDLASGIEVGNGGVFLGAPPYLWFLKDTNGDDKADKFEILLSGFGSEDTHETLNTFQWGPDGRLYGLHGVFTQSNVKPLDGPETRMNAAVWRYDVKTKQFEIFAEGTSNPWGMDWRNTDGQFILCCCVIPHLFHMSPGGIYKRQAGGSYNPHAYEYLNEICDHTFHRESGWAHAGLISLDVPHIPKQYRNSVIFGSIHGCSIKQNILKPNGSTYRATRGDDFLVSGDKNFRPINLRWGPNGEIYCIDWHDQNPCHQAAADSWDYQRGRVYRLQLKGTQTKKSQDLSKLSVAELRPLLKEANPYRQRTALRLLQHGNQPTEPSDPKKPQGDGFGALAQVGQNVNFSLSGDRWTLWQGYPSLRQGLTLVLDSSDSSVKPAAKRMASLLTEKAFQGEAGLVSRAWLVRWFGEQTQMPKEVLVGLAELASTESSAAIRRELASAALRLSGDQDTTALLRALLKHKKDATDPVIPQLVWLAYEKQVSKQRGAADPLDRELQWLAAEAPDNLFVRDQIVPRMMRRLVATGDPRNLERCLQFVADLKDVNTREKALDGIVVELSGRTVEPPKVWASLQPQLRGEPRLLGLANKLAVNFRDVAAIRRALEAIRQADRPRAERIEALRSLALTTPPEALQPLLGLVKTDRELDLRIETCRALAGFDSPEIPKTLLTNWTEYPPALRSELVNLLSSRRDWAKQLLAAVGNKRVARTELSDNTVLRIRGFNDKQLNGEIERTWGKIRERSPAELEQLISKMRVELHRGPASFERGRKVFELQCSKCHQFEGRGSEVGPPLDGAARDIEYLLANVLDPNRVVGAPYFTRQAVLKNGRIESGLLVSEDERTLILKGENDARKVIQKKDIDELTVLEKSVMPEGLAGAMSVQDFRDLIRYVMANPFLTDVKILGPLGREEIPARDVPSLLTQADRNWQQATVGAPGRIALPATEKPSTVVVVARLSSPSRQQTRLLFGAAGNVAVWLNDRPIQRSTTLRTSDPDQLGVEVELNPGDNVLIFRVDYQGKDVSLFARLLDPQRKLRQADSGK